MYIDILRLLQKPIFGSTSVRAHIKSKRIVQMKWIYFFFCALMAIFIGYLFIQNRRESVLGLHEGRLLPCPNRPNCVSSYEKGTTSFIEPLSVEHGTHPMEKLASRIQQFPNAKIIKTTPDYIHAVFYSPFFGFADDVEFVYDKQNNVIHTRSAARVGYWDFGVNRKRMEKIRTLLQNSHR